MENANRSFLDAVRKSKCQIRSANGAIAIDPKLRTAPEHLRMKGTFCLRRHHY